MLFNSIEYFYFLPITFLIYWIVLKGQLKSQNLFLLIISYIYYGFWDKRFLLLIAFSSIIDYSIGLQISNSQNKSTKKLFLTLSIIVNLGLLLFFKYCNFFIESFVTLNEQFGLKPSLSTLNIILPVGISFYTFQTLSYTIDIYRGKINPIKDPIAFFAFVSFFPQLVAGPIERATHLLPQFQNNRTFSYQKGIEGLRQILWGLVKKVVIADNCAVYVNQIFDEPSKFNGISLWIGLFLFSFQIYCDFSGYTDIAIGSARLFGFDLMQNFNYPYFSRNIGEFWRKWHISLTSWFKDYLYIPLGGSQKSRLTTIQNIFIVFIISGFWHGAKWTFICWGVLNALFFLPLIIKGSNRNYLIKFENKQLPTLKEFLQILITFIIISFTWIFFRAESIQDAFTYTQHLFDFEGRLLFPKKIIALILIFIIIEWFHKENSYGMPTLKNHKLMRRLMYYVLTISLFLVEYPEQQFLYFQF